MSRFLYLVLVFSVDLFHCQELGQLGQLGPIVPTNRNFYGSPYSNAPFGGQPLPSPYHPFPNQYPIHPINAVNRASWPPAQFGGSIQELAPYQHGSASNPYQRASPTVGMSTLGLDAISPINSYSNQMPAESSSFSSNRRASMPPIQVVYGKPIPMEMQTEQASSSSSLPLFLQGAPEDVINEYKQIIRKPNSNYDEQVKEINQLVLRLDSDKQRLYKEFMQENDERDQKHRDLIHKNVGEMSPKAQEQFVKISALLRNPEFSNEERWGRVLSFYGKLEPDLRNEFEEKFKDFGSN